MWPATWTRRPGATRILVSRCAAHLWNAGGRLAPRRESWMGPPARGDGGPDKWKGLRESSVSPTVFDSTPWLILDARTLRTGRPRCVDRILVGTGGTVVSPEEGHIQDADTSTHSAECLPASRFLPDDRQRRHSLNGRNLSYVAHHILRGWLALGLSSWEPSQRFAQQNGHSQGN